MDWACTWSVFLRSMYMKNGCVVSFYWIYLKRRTSGICRHFRLNCASSRTSAHKKEMEKKNKSYHSRQDSRWLVFFFVWCYVENHIPIMSRLQMCAIVKLYLPEMSQLYARAYHEGGGVEEISELAWTHPYWCFVFSTLFCFSMAIDHNSSVV